MAIYRGTGGSSTTTDETTINAVNQKAAEAATSASNAASSASSAATSASTANTKATQASTSATNAAASATSASQSANAASTSADAALAAQVAAELAETGAVGAESNAILFGNMANTAAADAVEARSFAEAANTSAQTYAAAALSSANDASSYDAAVQANATAAALSETNAAASETAASTAATNAASSATAANASAVSAAASESSVAANATAAAASETNAAASESAAATSESNASGSATAAANSASAASASASGASTSATNAAASETAAASSATSASASADAALAALDSFDDRYLGQKTSDPTLDNDGNALVAGALYFNTTDDVMKVYEGSTWVAAYASLSGALLQNNNLSDVLNVATARTNLGLAAVASSGDFNDLINQPSPFDPNTLATVATSGSYTDLINKPTLGTSAATDATAYATAAQGALADSAIQASGDTMTGNLSFGDNDKAIFGAGSDLQIYHDPATNDSFIKEAGGGSLKLFGTHTYIANDDGTQTLARFIVGGESALYNANFKRLATTSTGIDVTGTATMDGLTVDGNATVDGLYTDGAGFDTRTISGATVPVIARFRPNGTDGIIDLGTQSAVDGADAYVHSANSGSDLVLSNRNGSSDYQRLRLANNGDISFYEDTGTTAKFFWDASAESLGIGVSPVYLLDVYKAGGASVAASRSDTQATLRAEVGAVAVDLNTTGSTGEVRTATNHPLVLSTNSTERLRIDSSGNVGIGTSSPNAKAEVYGGNLRVALDGASAASFRGVEFSSSGTEIGSLEMEASGGEMRLTSGFSGYGGYSTFYTNGSERMRIDSSGNLLVGTTNTYVGYNNTNTGINLQSDLILASRNASNPMVLNRNNTDGGIIDLRKDGTTVGSIGTGSGYLTVGSGDTGLLFNDDTNRIQPWNLTANTSADAAIDIGLSSQRFKDLHLSGTANVNTVDLGNWTVTESGGVLYFATSGVNKMKLDASGNLTVTGEVTAYGTI